jgi:hypothetical protein
MQKRILNCFGSQIPRTLCGTSSASVDSEATHVSLMEDLSVQVEKLESLLNESVNLG